MLWWTLGYMCLFQFWFPRCVCLAVGLLGHVAVLFPVFKGISTLFSIMAILVCIPTKGVKDQCFSYFYFISFFFFGTFFFFYFLYCSGFCHTLKWNSHGFTCVPHPDTPSHLPLHLIPLGLPSAPGLSACLMHPTWAGDLFHPR